MSVRIGLPICLRMVRYSALHRRSGSRSAARPASHCRTSGGAFQPLSSTVDSSRSGSVVRAFVLLTEQVSGCEDRGELRSGGPRSPSGCPATFAPSFRPGGSMTSPDHRRAPGRLQPDPTSRSRRTRPPSSSAGQRLPKARSGAATPGIRPYRDAKASRRDSLLLPLRPRPDAAPSAGIRADTPRRRARCHHPDPRPG